MKNSMKKAIAGLMAFSVAAVGASAELGALDLFAALPVAASAFITAL